MQGQARRLRSIDTHLVVDQLIGDAVARGEFDNLPGFGKPLQGLGETHDPDWWLRKLVEREQISILPPGLQLRRDDALALLRPREERPQRRQHHHVHQQHGVRHQTEGVVVQRHEHEHRQHADEQRVGCDDASFSQPAKRPRIDRS